VCLLQVGLVGRRHHYSDVLLKSHVLHLLELLLQLHHLLLEDLLLEVL